MFDKLFDGKTKPAPPLPPEAAPDEPIAFEELRDEVAFAASGSEPHPDEGDGLEPEPFHEPPPLSIRAQRIAAEIEEMMATAQADAVNEATAPLEKTIAQMHGDLDALHADLGQLRTANNELRDRLAQIHATSALVQ